MNPKHRRREDRLAGRNQEEASKEKNLAFLFLVMNYQYSHFKETRP